MPAHGAGGLGQNCLVAWAAAAPHRATTAVEHAQLDGVACGQFVKQLYQRNLGTVQLPVAGEDAAVFVAVRVAQHDVLLATAALHQRGNAGQGIKLPHDGCGVAQVFNGFKQRHHNQIAYGDQWVGRSRCNMPSGVAAQHAAHQAHFFLQQQHFQQIAHGLGVADDVVANGVCAETLAHQLGRRKDGQLALRVG